MSPRSDCASKIGLTQVHRIQEVNIQRFRSQRKGPVAPLGIFARACTLLMCFSLVGCGNVFTDISDQHSDSAILYAANMSLSSGQWTQAITQIGTLTAATKNLRSTQVLLSSAYAGRCGLDIIALANTMQNNNGATNSFFDLIKAAFLGSTASQEADCVTAQTILQTAWGQTQPSATFSPVENILMAFIGLAEVGAIINHNGDPNATGTVIWQRPLHNDPCDATNGDTSLPISEVNQVVVGVSLTIQGLLAAGTSQSGSMQQILALCTGTGVLVSTGICSVSQTSQVNASERLAMRGLLEETLNGIGLGVYNNDFAHTVATCGDMN